MLVFCDVERISFQTIFYNLLLGKFWQNGMYLETMNIFHFVWKGIQIWQFMSIKEILLWFSKYENLDLFKFFVIEVIWINLWLVDYCLIEKWLHLPKYPPRNYENYLPIRYFYLCSEPSNCTNLNKTCNIDLKVQYLYFKNASYHFPSNELNL